MTAEVNKDKCISCGNCISSCPEVFAYDEINKAQVIKQPENQDEMDRTKNAANICPTQAITITE